MMAALEDRDLLEENNQRFDHGEKPILATGIAHADVQFALLTLPGGQLQAPIGPTSHSR
jgi:hypothetical protein